ncbi:MAG: hypothetical protein IJW21_03870 [Clostridia bacterium]|nr:hypothetical protein [Clostridia bacterium]
MEKIIADIRLFHSTSENSDGNAIPDGYGDKKLNVILHRVVMKLREQGFTLGEFDHLYINFTPCVPKGEIRPAARSVSREFSYFRYYDIGVSEEFAEKQDHGEIFALIKRALLLHFPQNAPEITENAFSAAVGEGENMLMRFKEKKAAKNTAVVFLRFLDDGRYLPLLCVYDAEGNEILRRDLPASPELLQIGEITLSSKKVTVKPRKSVFAKNLAPITFEF